MAQMEIPRISIPRNAPDVVKRAYAYFQSAGPTLMMASAAAKLLGIMLSGFADVFLNMMNAVQLASIREELAPSSDKPEPESESEQIPSGKAVRAGGYAGSK